MPIYDPTKMPANSFDTHTHLNDDAFWNELDAYVARAHEFRVMEMNVVGYDATGNERALEIAHKYDGVNAIIGFQPEDAKFFNDETAAVLRDQLNDPVVVGLGEMGLDYHWDTSSRADQLKAFEQQLEWAKELNKPVTIHSRDAMDDVYSILKNAHVGEFGGVMHSFTGNAAEAEKFLDLGMYISFSGIVTFKNSKDVQAAAKVVPLDRMLVETDAPYLAPTPLRGKQNEPAFVKYVVDGLAAQLEMDDKELATQTRANAHKLWSLD